MNKFFERLNNRVLKRGANGLYTLGDSELDKAFGLSQEIATLTPNKEAIESFASASFLYGLMGYKPTDYTAIPAGFLATYVSGDKHVTLFISSDKNAYYKEQIFNMFEESTKDKSYSNDEHNLFHTAKNLIASADMPLKEVCLNVGNEINTIYKIKSAADNIQTVINEFDSNIEGTVNYNNCENNHLLGAKVCCEYYFGVRYDDATADVQKQAWGIFNAIKDNWIIPRYFTYVGHDRNNVAINQDAQILNKKEHLIEFLELEKQIIKEFDVDKVREDNMTGERLSSKNFMLSILYNMCSTDYTADAVHDVIAIMKDVGVEKSSLVGALRKNAVDEAIEKALGEIDKLVPETPDNISRKDIARSNINIVAPKYLQNKKYYPDEVERQPE